MTRDEAMIIQTGYTGKMWCRSFADFHGDVEKRLGEPVFTHEFADWRLWAALREVYERDYSRTFRQWMAYDDA